MKFSAKEGAKKSEKFSATGMGLGNPSHGMAVAGTLDEYQREQLSRYRDKLLSLEHPPREAGEFTRLVRSFTAPTTNRSE